MADRLTAPPPISVQRVAMPQGGGGVQGMGEHFQAGAFSGEFSFAVPVPCSPCRGFEPELELAYSSMAGNGPFGLGFRVALSSVTRQTSRHIPRYDEDDIFLLDGDELTPVPGIPGVRTVGGTRYTVAAYRPRREVAFDRIERWRGPAGEDFWRVIDRSGVLLVYGRSAAARVADPGQPARIAEWLIESAVHPRGDVRSFTYKPEDDAGVPATAGEAARSRTAGRYPERIRYGNAAAYAAPDGCITPLPEQEWHFEIVFDYGEYDIDPGNDDPYTPVRPWPARRDPFSGYRYGFELRTHRLCRNILMFHRFTAELGSDPVLVHALSLSYDENAAATALTGCCLTGYRHYRAQPPGHRYHTRAVPPLTMGYAGFDPGANLTASPLTDVDGFPVEGFTGQSNWTVTDLYRDGVPGLLYADGQSAYYRRPVLAGPPGALTVSWSAREPLDRFPVERTAARADVMLSDLNGDGLLELVSTADGRNGFYPARGEAGWGPYVPFPSALPGDLGPDFGR
ncbi:MAG TPA: SpvB/TcaC N-terminal domain-containing protein, partial [Trebonia sp.]